MTDGGPNRLLPLSGPPDCRSEGGRHTENPTAVQEPSKNANNGLHYGPTAGRTALMEAGR